MNMVVPSGEETTFRVHPSWLQILSDPLRLAALSALRDCSSLTAAELSRATYSSSRAIRRHLDVLVDLDLVQEFPGERDGLTKGRPPGRFALRAATLRKIEPLLRVLGQPLGGEPERMRAPAQDRETAPGRHGRRWATG